jgi:LPXTG-motif cell wall-anchored protein
MLAVLGFFLGATAKLTGAPALIVILLVIAALVGLGVLIGRRRRRS